MTKLKEKDQKSTQRKERKEYRQGQRDRKMKDLSFDLEIL